MKGLKPGFEALPRTAVTLSTTSSSGPAKRETLQGIALSAALEHLPTVMLRITAQDGSMLALSPEDTQNAYLVEIEDGWQIVLPHDKTRKRFIKYPTGFSTES